MSRLKQFGLATTILAATACGYGGTTNNDNQNPPSPPQGTPVAAANVAVNDDFFSPNSVLLAVAGTVTWTWIGDNGHSVTPDGAPAFSPTAAISYPPKTLVVTFPTAGDYRYFCTNHGVAGSYSAGNMIGAIYVR